MVKSFFNSFFNGIGRTFGRILAYILIGLIFFFIYENANAMEQTGTFSITTPYDSPCGSGNSGYCAIQTNQSFYTRSLNSTYNGVLQCIAYNVHYRTESSYQYTLYIDAIDNDFRNNSLTHSVCGYGNYPSQCTSINSTMKYISKSKLSISFPSGVSYSNYTVNVCGSPLTGISNYGIKKTYFKYDDGQQDLSGIISNNNTNTDNIINNNNSNTQDIIDNQNQNTQDIIDNNNENFKNCFTNIFDINSYSSNTFDSISISNGQINVTGNSSWRTITYNFTVESGKQYTLYYKASSSANIMYQNSSGSYTEVVRDVFTVVIPTSNTLTIRLQNTSSGSFVYNNLMLTKGVSSVFVPYGQGEICSSKIDDVTSSIDNTNSKLDQMLAMPTVRLVLFSDSVQDWADYVSNPVGNFLLLPVQLVSKINTVSQNTCSDFNLGSLLGTNLTMECFTLSDILPSALVTTLDTIASMSLSFVILKKIYETITNMITLGGENEVKSYFHVPTPMEFMGSIFGG